MRQSAHWRARRCSCRRMRAVLSLLGCLAAASQSARPSAQPPQLSRWRCGAGIRDPVYRRCATSSTHSCTALRRSAGSGIGPLALAAALSPSQLHRRRVSGCLVRGSELPRRTRAVQPQAPFPLLRRLPLLRSDCLSEQVERGQQPAPFPLRRLPLLRSDCRSSEGSSQLHSHCGGCLCCGPRCGATAGRARAAASAIPAAERLPV